jgi:hypothetical protein
MNRKRCQPVFILLCCLQFVIACHVYAGYKLKWSSPDVQSPSYLFDGNSGTNSSVRDNSNFDMDGDNIPEIVVYEGVRDSSGYYWGGGFKITCYDSRTGSQKWQRIDTSALYDKSFSPPPLSGFFDVDADGEKEAILFKGGAVLAINLRTNVIEWSKETYTWPVVFDMDADGYVELGIQVSNSTTNKTHYEIWGTDKPIGTIQPVLAKQKTSNPFFNVFQAQMYSGTKIEYQVQKKGMVAIRIFNADGALVKDLVSGVKESGDYDVIWNGMANSGERAAAGNYFYQLSVDAFRSTKKAIILR